MAETKVIVEATEEKPEAVTEEKAEATEEHKSEEATENYDRRNCRR